MYRRRIEGLPAQRRAHGGASGRTYGLREDEAYKSLAAEESANVGFMSSQILSLSIIDKILHKWDIAKSEYAAYSTLCIEDVDISLHTPSSQTSAAYTVMRACEKQLVVLTGIKCEERIPVLLDTIKSPLRIFRYTAA